MMIALVAILFALVLLFDCLPGWKGRPGRANALYVVALVVSFCVLILYSAGVTVPGPTGLIKAILGQ